jgi:hypothetical protein
MGKSAAALLLMLSTAATLAEDRVPPGWKFASSSSGAYAAGTEIPPGLSGHKAAFLRAVSVADPSRSGSGLGHMVVADAYRGQRIRVSTRLKTENADSARCAMDVREKGLILAYANVPVAKGSHDWTDCNVVLDVSADATEIDVGFNMMGGGTVWSDGFRLEIVGKDVPLTENRFPPERPVNLGFERQRPS